MEIYFKARELYMCQGFDFDSYTIGYTCAKLHLRFHIREFKIMPVKTEMIFFEDIVSPKIPTKFFKKLEEFKSKILCKRVKIKSTN